MGMGTVQKGQKGYRRRPAFTPMSEINVTPMVDVMLVLLIVFMVSAPLLTVGVQVDLPQTKASALTSNDEPLVVTIDGKGQIFIQDTAINQKNLVPKLEAITHHKKDTKIFIKADKVLPYGKVMTAMGLISEAGYAKVSLMTEIQESTPTRKRR